MRPISIKVRPIPKPGLDTRGVLVATGRISVRSIADAIGCCSGSDRLRDGKMSPTSGRDDRSQVATETRDSVIGRRVIFSRGSGRSRNDDFGKNKSIGNVRGPIKRVPNDLILEYVDQKNS